jgi:branched-chain amino acid transport system ATP-binding protein
MEKGEIKFDGPTADLLARPDILRAVYVKGTGSLTDGAPAGARRSERDRRSLELEDSRFVLEVDSLVKHFGGVTAVNGVSFGLREGEVLGLIGPNGAGKTTIFDLISGHLSNDSGRIVLRGIDVTEWSADRRAEIGLGRSFQDARIFPSLTVAENIALGLERHIDVRDHVSALFATPAMLDSEADVAYTVDDLIHLMGLQAYRDKFVSELSTGSRRIVDLAMSIAHDPSVLLLDEPSSGIAQRETEALGPLLLRIREETGCAMLVIEHDMPLITAVSDEILALDLGAVVVQGPADEVMSDPRVITSYLGGDLAAIERSGAAAPKQRVSAARANGRAVNARTTKEAGR